MPSIRHELYRSVANAVEVSELITRLLEDASTSGRSPRLSEDQKLIEKSLSITSQAGVRLEEYQPLMLRDRVTSFQERLRDLYNGSTRHDLRTVVDFMKSALLKCLDVLQRLTTYSLVKLYFFQHKIHNILYSVETDLRSSFRRTVMLTPGHFQDTDSFKKSHRCTWSKIDAFRDSIRDFGRPADTLDSQPPQDDDRITRANDWLEEFPERVKSGKESPDKLCTEYMTMYQEFKDLLTDKELAGCLECLGSDLFNKGNFELSANCHRHCLRMRREVHEGAHASIAKSLQDLGLALTRVGRSQEAVGYLRQSYDMQVDLEVDGAAVAVCLNSLAYWTWQFGQCETAQQLYFDLLKLETDVYGPDHENVGCTLHNLACLLLSSGRTKSAKYVFEQALDVRSKTRVPDKDLAATLHSFGKCLYKLKDFPAAEKMHLEALTTRMRAYGERHCSVAEILSNLSLVYFEQGKLDKAEQVLIQVAKLHQELQGVSPSDVASCFMNLGLVYREKGQFHAAAVQFKKALATLAHEPKSDTQRVQFIKQELRKAEAAAREQQMVPGFQRTLQLHS